jgi:hypothetical protein
LQAANSDLKKKHANDLQTILTEMRELEQKNAEYQKQIVESRQASKAHRDANNQRGIAGYPSFRPFSIYIIAYPIYRNKWQRP